LNQEFNSNILSRSLKKYVKFAYHPEDIMVNIEELRANKYILPSFEAKQCDTKICSIKKAVKFKFYEIFKGESYSYEHFKQMLDPVENPASKIADVLLYDQ
jgi:hypothetical protein